MKLGLFGAGAGAMAQPATMSTIGRRAEDMGFDSLWTGEHMVAPSPRVPPSPIEPDYPMLDPMAALSYLAAITDSILLGSGVLLLPQRPPVALAKEAASLDVLSGGRFLMGVGVGYLQPEFEAVGADFANRGSVAEEHIEAMRALWAMDQPAFHGRRVQFEGVDAHPRPIQPGGPRLVMGGHSKPAFRRSVTMAHEWYGFGLDLAATEACLDGLRLAANQYERPAELGPLVVSVTPRGRLDRGAVESFAAIGIDRLIPMIRGADEPGIMADLDALDPAVLLA